MLLLLVINVNRSLRFADVKTVKVDLLHWKLHRTRATSLDDMGLNAFRFSKSAVECKQPCTFRDGRSRFGSQACLERSCKPGPALAARFSIISS
jgi:hypothetical protein